MSKEKLNIVKFAKILFLIISYDQIKGMQFLVIIIKMKRINVIKKFSVFKLSEKLDMQVHNIAFLES